jgi:hypothetical protein
VLTTIADFAYAGEIRELNKTLFAIEARCSAEDVASAFVDTVKRVQEYRNALNDYALKADHLQQRLAERRRQYLEFGEQLDNFARSDPRSQKAGEAPTPGDKQHPAGERYANIMVLTSAVREVVGMGRAALAADNVGDEVAIRAWFEQIREHRNSVDFPRHGFIDKYEPSYIRWPEVEQQPIEQLYNQVHVFRQHATNMVTTLAPVDAAAENLIKALHPSGGSGAY